MSDDVTTGETTGAGTRVVVVLLVLATVASVLVAATVGTFFVGYAAQGACTPDGEGSSCVRTTVLPWTNVGLQVVLLVASLGWGQALRRRAASSTGAAGATLAVALGTVAVAAVVVGVLMTVAEV